MNALSRAALLGLILLTNGLAQDREIRAMAGDLAEKIAARSKGPVAITSFVNSEYGPAFSTFLVDRLNILLASSNEQFDVVSRSRIEEAFHEINLALGRNYDSSTFAKIGRTVGAKALVQGSFTVMQSGATVSVTAQVLDVETGKIIGGTIAELPYTGDIKTMLTPQVPSESNSIEGQTSPRQEQQLEIMSVLFRLKSCAATRTAVTCKVLVKSPERDRNIRIGNWTYYTKIYDQAGKEFRMSQVSMANKSDSNSIDTLLVRDVPTLADFTFAVTSNVSTISLFKLNAYEIDSSALQLDVQFRNISPR